MGIPFTDNPQGGHTLAADQPNILHNFQYLGNTLNTDHQIGPTTTNRTDNIPQEGNHTVIHFVSQVGNPGPIANVGQLYTKIVGGDVALFYESGTGTIQQLVSNNTPIIAATGSSFIGGGLIFKWGTQLLNAGGNTTINFASAFPTNVFSITTCLRSATGGLNDTDHYILGTPTLNLFVIRNPTGHAYTLNYMAIGN